MFIQSFSIKHPALIISYVKAPQINTQVIRRKEVWEVIDFPNKKI